MNFLGTLFTSIVGGVVAGFMVLRLWTQTQQRKKILELVRLLKAKRFLIHRRNQRAQNQWEDAIKRGENDQAERYRYFNGANEECKSNLNYDRAVLGILNSYCKQIAIDLYEMTYTQRSIPVTDSLNKRIEAIDKICDEPEKYLK